MYEVSVVQKLMFSNAIYQILHLNKLKNHEKSQKKGDF
jgi:hypothetical protein